MIHIFGESSSLQDNSIPFELTVPADDLSMAIKKGGQCALPHCARPLSSGHWLFSFKTLSKTDENAGN